MCHPGCCDCCDLDPIPLHGDNNATFTLTVSAWILYYSPEWKLDTALKIQLSSPMFYDLIPSCTLPSLPSLPASGMSHWNARCVHQPLAAMTRTPKQAILKGRYVSFDSQFWSPRSVGLTVPRPKKGQHVSLRSCNEGHCLPQKDQGWVVYSLPSYTSELPSPNRTYQWISTTFLPCHSVINISVE